MSRPPSTRSLRPVVSTQDEFSARFFALRSSGPVVNQMHSPCHTAISGVTCGLPSGRTVESQNVSASMTCLSPTAHGVGVASGWLKPWISAVTSAGITHHPLLGGVVLGSALLVVGSALPVHPVVQHHERKAEDPERVLRAQFAVVQV